MESFEIGWAPEGWQRGNPLRTINNDFRDGCMAALYYKVQSLDGDIPEIGAVQFHASEARRVNAWLEWWYGAILNAALEEAIRVTARAKTTSHACDSIRALKTKEGE